MGRGTQDTGKHWGPCRRVVGDMDTVPGGVYSEGSAVWVMGGEIYQDWVEAGRPWHPCGFGAAGTAVGLSQTLWRWADISLARARCGFSCLCFRSCDGRAFLECWFLVRSWV